MRHQTSVILLFRAFGHVVRCDCMRNCIRYVCAYGIKTYFSSDGHSTASIITPVRVCMVNARYTFCGYSYIILVIIVVKSVLARDNTRHTRLGVTPSSAVIMCTESSAAAGTIMVPDSSGTGDDYRHKHWY